MKGRHPAVIKSYNAATRTCRVEIPGITNGGDVYPEAQIDYPVGDKSKAGPHSTEIEILVGDLCWVEFINDDPELPIIVGYRCPRTGNSTGLRRFHHSNIELHADTELRLIVGTSTIVMTATGITLTADNIDLIADRIDLN